jgi:putative metallopeptidase DUF4344
MQSLTRIIVSVVALVALIACAPSDDAVAQTIPKNPQIEIDYVAPHSDKYQPIYRRLKDLQVLETLQEFLSPLRLPRKIAVKTDECNSLRLVYRPPGPVIICYEYILAIELNAPAASAVPIGGKRVTKESIIVGGFVNEMLSEVAHAVFDVLQIPVWGSANDAADNVAALIMSSFGDDVAWRTLIGTSWFLAQRSYVGRGDFTEVIQSSEAPRFYNYLCIAYSANPKNFSFLKEDIPKGRLEVCEQDYRQLVRSFKQTIMPHVDPALLKQVRAVDWMTRLKMTKS